MRPPASRASRVAKADCKRVASVTYAAIAVENTGPRVVLRASLEVPLTPFRARRAKHDRVT